MPEAVAHQRHHDALKAAEALLDRWLPSKPPRIPLRNPFDVLEDDVAKALPECLVGPVRLPVSERNLYALHRFCGWCERNFSGPAPRFQVVNDRAGALFVEVLGPWQSRTSRRTHYPHGQITLDRRVMLNADNFALSVSWSGTSSPPNVAVSVDLLLSNDQAAREAELPAISAMMDRRELLIGYQNGNLRAEMRCKPYGAKLLAKLGEPTVLSLVAHGQMVSTQGM